MVFGIVYDTPDGKVDSKIVEAENLKDLEDKMGIPVKSGTIIYVKRGGEKQEQNS